MGRTSTSRPNRRSALTSGSGRPQGVEGEYEVSGGTIRLYDASDGTTNSSDFSATPDGGHITFYGKDFTRIGDTTNLRPTGAG